MLLLAAWAAAVVVAWLYRNRSLLYLHAVLAAALFIIGIQIFFSSFLLSILGLRRTRQPLAERLQSEPRKLEPTE